MTRGISEDKAKWLTYLVYLLLMFLTAVTGWGYYKSDKNQETISKLPSEYVRLERYLSDKSSITREFDGINKKLDTLIDMQMRDKDR